jgi:hypothetical protein
MKRCGVWLASAFLVPLIAGCGGGLQEGMATEPNPTGQTASFRAEMEKNAKNMSLKNARPRNAPGVK